MRVVWQSFTRLGIPIWLMAQKNNSLHICMKRILPYKKGISLLTPAKLVQHTWFNVQKCPIWLSNFCLLHFGAKNSQKTPCNCCGKWFSWLCVASQSTALSETAKNTWDSVTAHESLSRKKYSELSQTWPINIRVFTVNWTVQQILGWKTRKTIRFFGYIL